jgi:hypothetical protein
VAILVLLIALVLAWSWLLDADRRAGLELVLDHNCHEAWEWKAESGTKLPTTASAARRWLEDHPEGTGRASMLLRLGRLSDADAAIGEMKPDTPEEAFGVEILRKTREHLAGAIPDLESLHASWRSMPDPRERRHRRECLALLDAVIDVGEGRDPWPGLASARAEIGEVHPSMRMPRLAAKWGAIQLAVALVPVVLTAVLRG